MNADKKKQCYKVITREEVAAALDQGFIPVVQVFLDDRGEEIGTGIITLVEPDVRVVRILPKQ